jgi:predicted CopG family antitoxin
MSESENTFTTLTVRRETHRELEKLKPYQSMSFDELIREMAESYRGD